ncbi:MAG: ABC transporter ATP-binding protein [Anaerolineae bacterium]|jgi:ABC-2 type transport system ATP-binding protein|nr:ABC transporter ATP-binding protein [Anaerolineae bacterium]
MKAIETQHLVKVFGDLRAVDDVSFNVEEGEIFSLLGPNGAGKSTTISMISGLLSPTEGDAFIFGHSVRKTPTKAQELLGIVPQELAIYPDLTAKQNLMFWGRMFGLRGETLKARVKDILELIELSERQNQNAGKYSGGMKRRLNIGIALLHRPKLIILDEPTVGIDPQSRRKILDSVKQFRDQGTTVLYTTHYMEEAAELSDRIGIIDNGKLIATGTQDQLSKLVGEKERVLLSISDPDRMADIFEALPHVDTVERLDGHSLITTDDADGLLPRLFEIAQQEGEHISSVEIQEVTLETVFLHLTGRALRE